MNLQLASGTSVTNLSLPDGTVVHSPSANETPDVLSAALQNPLGLPVLPECVVPGDRVVIVVEAETPNVVDVVTQVWAQFQELNTDELDVTLLLSASSDGVGSQGVIDDLPVHVRSQLATHIHDPADENQRRYLASSAGGERLYLSHYVTDADFIISIGTIGFDGVLGYRGTNSAIYPAFSDTEAIKSAKQNCDSELMPEDKRPLRDLVDEIGWLLGTQFTVQIVPDSAGGIERVFCGATDEAMAAAKQHLNERYRLTLEEEIHLAVVSIPGNSDFGWRQLGAALGTAARIVGEDGRIAVVAELPTHIGPGLEMLRRSKSPEDLLPSLNEDPPEDAVEVTQLIHVLRTAQVFLFSNLDAQFVEDLGILPISTDTELQRAIDSSDNVIVVPCANYVWAQVGVGTAISNQQ
ncbi:MAG: lactate racemase domain-containing protein [Fuerstiella sp.]|nr:lactate racemase domain-containing protein [Fuerstiella sp.]